MYIKLIRSCPARKSVPFLQNFFLLTCDRNGKWAGSSVACSISGWISDIVGSSAQRWSRRDGSRCWGKRLARVVCYCGRRPIDDGACCTRRDRDGLVGGTTQHRGRYIYRGKSMCIYSQLHVSSMCFKSSRTYIIWWFLTVEEHEGGVFRIHNLPVKKRKVFHRSPFISSRK